MSERVSMWGLPRLLGVPLMVSGAAAGLAARGVVGWWVVVVLALRDVLVWCLVPLLRSRGYAMPPGHPVGGAAALCLLGAAPLLLVGGDVGVGSTLASVFGWALAWWGVALYWSAALLCSWQVRRLLSTAPRRRRTAGGWSVDA